MVVTTIILVVALVAAIVLIGAFACYRIFSRSRRALAAAQGASETARAAEVQASAAAATVDNLQLIEMGDQLPTKFLSGVTFSTHTSAAIALAVLDLACHIVKFGVGEGKPAHGFAIAVCDGARMLSVDAEGDPNFGSPNDANHVFSQGHYYVQDLVDQSMRSVLNEFNKDGMILVDGQTGRFVASNFMVVDIRKGHRGGGARHMAASSMAQFDGGNMVVKASEDVCKAFRGHLDVFLMEKTATRFEL